MISSHHFQPTKIPFHTKSPIVLIPLLIHEVVIVGRHLDLHKINHTGDLLEEISRITQFSGKERVELPQWVSRLKKKYAMFGEDYTVRYLQLGRPTEPTVKETPISVFHFMVTRNELKNGDRLRYLITDLHGTNGTFVNKMQLRPYGFYILREGARIQCQGNLEPVAGSTVEMNILMTFTTEASQAASYLSNILECSHTPTLMTAPTRSSRKRKAEDEAEGASVSRKRRFVSKLEPISEEFRCPNCHTSSGEFVARKCGHGACGSCVDLMNKFAPTYPCQLCTSPPPPPRNTELESAVDVLTSFLPIADAKVRGECMFKVEKKNTLKTSAERLAGYKKRKSWTDSMARVVSKFKL